VPGEIRDRVRNFFANIADPMIGVNNMLQGKFEEGFFDWVRFGFNPPSACSACTTSPPTWATRSTTRTSARPSAAGVRRRAVSGAAVLGSSTCATASARASTSHRPDGRTAPRTLRWGLVGVRVVQVRADLLDASRILEEAALDKYTFQRDAYLQRRRSLIYDGRPPREREPESRVNPREDGTLITSRPGDAHDQDHRHADRRSCLRRRPGAGADAARRAGEERDARSRRSDCQGQGDPRVAIAPS
jgi:phospholipid-binding lipoprotein MlaA